MSTQAVTPNVDDDPFAKFATPSPNQPAAVSTAADSDDPFAKFAAGPSKQATADPAQYASDTRQMLVSGLTGMPTPNMTDADKQSFATGKAVGAGSATLLSVAPLLGALAPHLPTLGGR
jgi:hypothetical protein